MADQELFLLQLLKVPVFIIKFLSKLLSILTYTPNYLFLYLVDAVVFSSKLQATIASYILSWIPRLALLLSGLAMFCLQFYLIFSLMQLEEHGWIIQTLGMFLTLAGLLILMRKGYLSMIEKYNLTKLKSPMEHIEIGLLFIVDIVGIFLGIINALLVLNITRTFSYQYDPNSKFRFIRHVVGLIKDSSITILEFFYIKVFFRIFPWRFVLEKDIFLKEKEQQNVLNCLVLLTLIYLSTLLDIIVVAIFGLPLVIDFQRRNYYKYMSNDHRKAKVTLQHFGFVLARTMQLICEAVCFPFCWKESKCAILLTVSYTKTSELYGKEFSSLLKATALRVPYLICNTAIFLSYYKYQKKKVIVAELNKQQVKVDEWINTKLTFECFGELIVDIFVYPFIIAATILKPWQYRWLKYLANDYYELNRLLVFSYLGKIIIQIIFLPLATIMTILVLLYDFKKPQQLYKIAGEYVDKEYLAFIKERQGKQAIIDKELKSIEVKSQIKHYTYDITVAIIDDLPHLPYFFIAKATFLNLYDKELLPQTTGKLLKNLHLTYLRDNVKSSSRYPKYEEMYKNMLQKGEISRSNYELQFKFWQYAYKTQRFIKIQTFVKLLISNKSIERIIGRTKKEENLSELAIEYWYQWSLLKTFMLKFIFMIIEIILSIIGIVFMLPLTLWRIPTFIKLYLIHKDRQYFFSILFKMYTQLFYDIITLPLKLIVLLIAPIMYYRYVKSTSFNYGPSLQTFQLYQETKRAYFISNVLLANLALGFIHFEICSIYLFWIRIKNFRSCLRRNRFTLRRLYLQLILTSPAIPTIEQILTNEHNKTAYYKNFETMLAEMNIIFADVIRDFPYIFLMFLVFITMPWRINYIIQVIQNMRQDGDERKSFFKLMKNIVKDYTCIFLSLVLLFSGIKTRKALILIRRNFRLNFFIGFLQYSYFKELKSELKDLFAIYRNIVYFFIAAAFGWTRADKMVSELIQIRKIKKHEQESAAANRIIHDNTVKQKKELQLLNKMGFYDYLTVCSFLNIQDIINLRKTDKFNYLMTKRQEVWFTKWELGYAGKYDISDESFEYKCLYAFKLQNSNRRREIATYSDVILLHFTQNVFENCVDISQFCSQKLPPRLYDRIFKDYTYSIREGYGPEDQLPQNDHEDEEFLRLTNQTRKMKTIYTENDTYLNWLYQKPIEKLAQKLHGYFRVDSKRRIKQALIILLVCLFVVSYLTAIWQLRGLIFTFDSLIGIKLLLAFYFHSFWFAAFLRFQVLYQQWISLSPFDLYQDIVDLVKKVYRLIVDKAVTPAGNLLKKLGRAIANQIQKILEKLADAAIKTKDVTIKYSLLAYQKVIKPLYISIADKIRKLRDFVAKIFEALFNSIKSLLIFIGKVVRNLYEGIRAIFSNINQLYYTVLKTSMNFLLGFGVLGNLLFTLFGLIIMTLPSLIWWFFYPQRWYLVVSTIHTMVLIVVGYKHLNKIRSQNAA